MLLEGYKPDSVTSSALIKIYLAELQDKQPLVGCSEAARRSASRDLQQRLHARNEYGIFSVEKRNRTADEAADAAIDASSKLDGSYPVVAAVRRALHDFDKDVTYAHISAPRDTEPLVDETDDAIEVPTRVLRAWSLDTPLRVIGAKMGGAAAYNFIEWVAARYGIAPERQTYSYLAEVIAVDRSAELATELRQLCRAIPETKSPVAI